MGLSYSAKRTIAAHCAKTGAAEPADLEARLDLHLQILWAALGVEAPPAPGLMT